MSNMNMEDDGDDKDDTKRRTRNLKEKKRRDQFNMLVNELGTLVSTNNRKMDKFTVLKTTLSFLKNHNEITVRSRAHDVQEDWKPAFLSNEEFTYLVLEALEGFVMVFSATGKIYYVSESVTSLLGHNPADVVNKSIFDLTYEEERPNLYNLLQRHLATAAATDQTHSVSKDGDTVMFEVHLRRGALDFREDAAYELVTFSGHFRANAEIVDSDHDMGFQHDLESRMVFVCTGRLLTPQLIRDVSLVDPNRSEFTSRHSLEWKFLFLDHRAPPIIGYLPFEVLGTSGYDYYHFDDLEKVVTCHEALMQKRELTSCYYRFLTKGQQWIWLQTSFYITYSQWNSKPEFVVCTHRVVSYADISKSTKEEVSEVDAVSEDAGLVTMSPSYMSEAGDSYVTSYQTTAQAESNQGAIKDAAAEDATMTPVSPSYMSEGSDTYTASYRTSSQISLTRRRMKGAHSDDVALPPVSPSYTSEASELYGNSYRTHSQQTHKSSSEPSLAPQHGIGAQYLDQAPYVGPVTVPGVLPLPLPVIVPQDPTQMQEQLQRKYEELQQMMVRQQEELRQVKEQLLLARLGILQPLINVPYVNHEGLHLQQQVNPVRPHITYDSNNRVVPYPAHGLHTTHAPHTQQVPQLSHPQLVSLPQLTPQPPHAPLVAHPPHAPHAPHAPHSRPHAPHAPGPHHHMPQ